MFNLWELLVLFLGPISTSPSPRRPEPMPMNMKNQFEARAPTLKVKRLFRAFKCQNAKMPEPTKRVESVCIGSWSRPILSPPTRPNSIVTFRLNFLQKNKHLWRFLGLPGRVSVCLIRSAAPLNFQLAAEITFSSFGRDSCCFDLFLC